MVYHFCVGVLGVSNVCAWLVIRIPFSNAHRIAVRLFTTQLVVLQASRAINQPLTTGTAVTRLALCLLIRHDP